MQHLSPGNVALAVSGSMLLTLALGSAADAITSDSFTYSLPKTGYLTLLPAAFTPSNPGLNYSNDGGTLRPSTTDRTCWTAPVNLPQGASMTVLAVWYSRDTQEQASIRLIRQELEVQAPAVRVVILDKSLPDSFRAYKQVDYRISGEAKIVDNRHYGYFVEACLDGTFTTIKPHFYGVRITYKYTTAGD